MEIKKSVRTFRDSGEISYELIIDGYTTMGVHNTYNCQMYVIAGFEELYKILSLKKIAKVLDIIHKLEYRNLMLIDVEDFIAKSLTKITIGTDIILSQQRFKSTNGHYRNILVLNILDLCTLLNK